MTFEVPANAYGRFMGQYSAPLAARFVGWCDVRPGQRALDVGCGPGVLTHELVAVLGAGSVSAVDPSPPFVDAAVRALPGVDVRTATAEDLPFGDGLFDRTLAQLVVHFMTDPVGGLREMARVTAPDGIVAANVWDHAGRSGPLTAFWDAVARLDPGHPGEGDLPGTRAGHLVDLFREAGLHDVEGDRLTVTRHFAAFEDWWEPYTLGVGPAGAYVAALDDDGRAALRDVCRARLPDGPFEVTASAWCARARP